MNAPRHPWALVIFACRESLPQLRQTLDAALRSAAACSVIHLLINGNPALASGLAGELNQRPTGVTKVGNSPAIRVWSIPLGDKANAWNQYIHQLWAGEEIVFFVDGYVRLNTDAVDLLGNAVGANALALGGTGVPTMGRSAKALRENMIINTGFHGNFCCIKGDALRQMRDQQIRLPLGLYRTDSLMGAFLCYALDPGNHVWEDYRIHVHPSATWQFDPARWWHIKDVQAHFKRYFLQIRGRLENAAFADHSAIRLRSPAELPATAQELVLEWARRCPHDFTRLAKHYWLMKPALASFQSARPGAAASPEPTQVWPDARETT